MRVDPTRWHLGLGVLLAVASIAVLWGHGTAEHTAALRWMQG